MRKRKFDPEQDIKIVIEYQSVDSELEMSMKRPDLGDLDIRNKRIEQGAYSCLDEFGEALWNDDAIYISVTNEQHQAIVDYSNGKTEHLGNLGLGFFTDEATVNAAMQGEALNNKLFNEMCQIAPYHEVDRVQKIDEYNFKPHVDKLVIDRDRLEELYGRKELPVLVSRCLANDVNTPGGGHQGYSHLIDQLIEDGVLVHIPEESYSRYDRDLLVSEKLVTKNKKPLIKNTIDEDEYDLFIKAANSRGLDCVEHNTPHPSQNVQDATRAKGACVKLNAQPGNSTPKSFIDMLKRYVEYFTDGKKEFTHNDERQLAYVIQKEMHTDCRRMNGNVNCANTYVHQYLGNESVKNPITLLEEQRKSGSFCAGEFCRSIANDFNQPRDYERGRKQLVSDAKISGIKITSNIEQRYQNMYLKTGDACSLQEIAEISKGANVEFTDKDVKAIAEECRMQQIQAVYGQER